MKEIAEGFGREEEIFRDEINIRAFMNCWANLLIFSTIGVLL